MGIIGDMNEYHTKKRSPSPKQHTQARQVIREERSTDGVSKRTDSILRVKAVAHNAQTQHTQLSSSVRRRTQRPRLTPRTLRARSRHPTARKHRLERHIVPLLPNPLRLFRPASLIQLHLPILQLALELVASCLQIPLPRLLRGSDGFHPSIWVDGCALDSTLR